MLPQSSSHIPMPLPGLIFPNPPWTQCISHHMLYHPDHSHWNKSHLFHISRLITYPLFRKYLKSRRKVKRLGEKAENRSSLAMPLMHHVCKRVRGIVPKQLEWNDRERNRAAFGFFQVRPGLTVKSACGWPGQSLLTSTEGGAEEDICSQTKERNGPMMLPCSLLLAQGNALALTDQAFSAQLCYKQTNKPPKNPAPNPQPKQQAKQEHFGTQTAEYLSPHWTSQEQHGPSEISRNPQKLRACLKDFM